MIKKLTLFICSLFLITNVYAGTATRYNTYAPTGEVNADNLNGNFNNILTVLNGGIDSTNIATGYRLLEVVGSLPVSGDPGKVVFLTSDNSLNFDTGSAWSKALTISGTPVQGDLAYYNGSIWSRLAAGTASYPLVTNGAATTPVYAVLTRAGGGTGVTGAAGAANSVVNLDASAKLPTYDGSQLTNLPVDPTYSNLAFVFIPDEDYSHVWNGGAITLGATTFKKIAGADTLTLYARVNATNDITIAVTINGVTANITSSGAGWKTPASVTLDVSSCTTGTAYAVTATGVADGGSNCYVMEIIGIAS